jgi:hypothetical protein
MNSLRREHWEQARAFCDWIDKQDDDTETAALLKPHYTAWARTKEFEIEDVKIIWKLVLFRRREQRQKPIKKRNTKRLERIRAAHTYGPYHRWIGSRQCVFAIYPDHECMRYPDRDWVKGHHIVTVATGGRDWANEIPVCLRAHAMCHASWMKVEERYGIHMLQMAVDLADECPMEVIDTIKQGGT